MDGNKITGVVLLDISKAFDCIPCDVLLPKLNAYGFYSKTLKLVYSNLKGQKQSACNSNIYINFLEI